MAGLPAAMLKKREDLRAKHPELTDTTQPANVVIPIDVPSNGSIEGGDPSNLSPETPPTEPADKPLTLDEQYRITAEKWENKFRTLEGVVKNLEPELRSERETRAKLERELQELREAMPRPASQPNLDEELTTEEMEVYGASAPIIQKIARKIARGELEGALKDLRKEIAQLKETTGRVESGVSQSEEERFVDSVKRNVKNFDKIIVSQEWRDYLEQRAPYTKDTISKMLNVAHSNRDLDSVLEIFNGFKPSKAALASMTSPSLGGGAAPISTNGNQKPMLKFSDRKKMSDDKRMGRIKTPEQVAEWNKWDQMFREAEAEGRIDYQK